jgi:hypothetical protein
VAVKDIGRRLPLCVSEVQLVEHGGEQLRDQRALPLRQLDLPLGEPGGDGLRGHPGAAVAFLRFEVGESADGLAGGVDPAGLGVAVGVADQGGDAARVEDAAQVVPGDLRGRGLLDTLGRLD